MRRKEDAVFRVRSLLFRDLRKELLDTVHLAVQERRQRLVVRRRVNDGQVRFAQDGRAEHF